MSLKLYAMALALARKAGCSRAWRSAGRQVAQKVCPEGGMNLKVAAVSVLNPFVAYVCTRGGPAAIDQVAGEMCEGVQKIAPEDAIREGGRIARMARASQGDDEDDEERAARPAESPREPRRTKLPSKPDGDPLPRLLANLDYRRAEIDQALASGAVPPHGAASVQERLRKAIAVLSGRVPSPAVATAGLDFGAVFGSYRSGL